MILGGHDIVDRKERLRESIDINGSISIVGGSSAIAWILVQIEENSINMLNGQNHEWHGCDEDCDAPPELYQTELLCDQQPSTLSLSIEKKM